MVDIYYPLQWIADKLTYGWDWDRSGVHLGASVDFIIYEVMKILILRLSRFLLSPTLGLISLPKKRDKHSQGKKDYNIIFWLL